MSNLNIRQIRALYALYPKTTTLYDDGRVNLFAIRSNQRKANAYDDRLYAVRYRKGNGTTDAGAWEIRSYIVTVDPGLPQLTNPTFKRAQQFGTAILKEGETYFFKWAWIGTGKLGHRCLLQDSDVEIYQDNNRNGFLDFVNPVRGKFGICIHAYGGVVVNHNSAGCTDFKFRYSSNGQLGYHDNFLPYLSRYNPAPALTPYSLFLESQAAHVLSIVV